MQPGQELAAIWSLASTPELLPRRLTSQLILSLLDELLAAAALPLFQHTTYMRRLLLQMLLQFSTDNRRKLSALPRPELYALLLKAILTGDFSYVLTCKLDRSLLFRMVADTYAKLEKCGQLEAAIAVSRGRKQQRLLRKRRCIALQLGTPEHMLAPLTTWVAGYILGYTDFRWMITTKYLKLAYHYALKAAYDTKLHVDRQDLFRNLVMAIGRAIDKCDQTKGTLTAYVEQWFLSARNHPDFPHQYGVSFSLPQAVRRQLEKQGQQLTDFTGNMPHEDAIPDVNEQSLELRLRNEADRGLLVALRYAKKTEIAVLALNLPIVLTALELQRLRGDQHNDNGKPTA